MRVVALDLSLTATGVADTGSSAPGTLVPPRCSPVERLEWIMRKVLERTEGADLVLLEGYAFARPNQAHQVGELGGVVRLALFVAGSPFVVVPPKTIKKLATGRGNARKEEVLVAAVRRLGYQGADNNQADALWLLQCAQQEYGLPGKVELPKTHLLALESIRWPDGLMALVRQDAENWDLEF